MEKTRNKKSIPVQEGPIKKKVIVNRSDCFTESNSIRETVFYIPFFEDFINSYYITEHRTSANEAVLSSKILLGKVIDDD